MPATRCGMRISCDDGYQGTGYSYTIGSGGSSVVALLRDHLAPRLIGRDPSLIEQIPFPRLQDVLDYHSSIAQAAETAARAGVSFTTVSHVLNGTRRVSEESRQRVERAVAEHSALTA